MPRFGSLEERPSNGPAPRARIISADLSIGSGKNAILTTVKDLIRTQISVIRAHVRGRQIRSERLERIALNDIGQRQHGL